MQTASYPPEVDFVSLHVLFAPGSRRSPPLSLAPLSSLEARVRAVAGAADVACEHLDALVLAFARHETPERFLALVCRLADGSDGARPREVLGALLYRWAVWGPRLDGPVLEDFRSWKEGASSSSSSLFASLLEETNRAAGNAGKEKRSVPSPSMRDWPQPSDSNSHFWRMLHPQALAGQLTALDEGFIGDMSVSEALLGKFWPSARADAFSAWMRRCPLWVATEIVLADSTDRPKAIVYFLKVAVQLLEMRNVHSFALVMQGLQLEPVQRLSQAWEPVLEVHGESWGKLKTELLPRRLLDARRSPWMVPIGQLQDEIAAILLDVSSEHDLRTIGGQWAVDWEAEKRIRTVSAMWWQARHDQSHVYGIAQHEPTQKHLLQGLDVLSSSELGLVSRQQQSESQTLSDAVKSSGGVLSGFSTWLRKSGSGSSSEEAVLQQRSLPDVMFLAGADWAQVFGKAEVIKPARQTNLLDSGERNLHLWRVRKGAVSVFSNDGFILGTFGEGQVFGELIMVSPMGMGVAASVVAVSPVCEVQRVTFTQVATVLKAQIQLRVAFYESLSFAIASRVPLSAGNFDRPSQMEASKKESDASAKFFRRFDLKNESLIAKWPVFWTESCALQRVLGKMYVTKNYLAVRAHAFGVTFRYVAILAKVTQVKQVGEKEVEVMAAPQQRITVALSCTEEAVAMTEKLKEIASVATVPPHQGFVPDLDNRSWEFLMIAGARQVKLQQDEMLDLSSNCIYHVASGSLVATCLGQQYHVHAGSSFGEASFFKHAHDVIQVRAACVESNALIYALPWSHLAHLSAVRPDVASNFLRHTAALLAARVEHPLATLSLALTSSLSSSSSSPPSSPSSLV